jgi:hypothetical protein
VGEEEEEEETVGVLVDVAVVAPPHALQKRLTRTSIQRKNQKWAGLFVNMCSSFQLSGRQASNKTDGVTYL